MKKLNQYILSIVLLLSGCIGQKAKATASPAAEEPQYACRAIDRYDYSAPVPFSEAIDESYYKDTLFAGDSRMGALQLYGSHKDAEVDYVTSLNLMMIDNMKVDLRKDGKTLMDVLNETTKQNIYLLFGINEIRNPSFDYFAEKFQEIITMLKDHNPSVNIYIVLSYHPESISGLNAEQLTKQLTDLNDHLANLAVSNYAYYLNPDYAMDDANGIIRDEYVADGLHLTPTGTKAFEDFFATHVVRRETYVQEICE